MLRPSSPALRPFQEPVVAKARDANVVMVGATGIGKTFVAVALLAQQHYDTDQRAFVLAPTRQLVWQITAKMRAATTLRATALGGRTTTDHWDAREWGRALAVTHVVVCTPDVLRSALERAFVRMAQINLLVLDECHHVSKRHPYAQIAKLYAATPDSERPRVFGATATPTRDCARRLHAEMVRVELPVDETVASAAAAPVQWEGFEKEPPPPPSPAPVVSVDGYEQAETELERSLAREFRGSVYHRFYELLTELQAVQVLRRLLEEASAGSRSAARLDKAVQRFVRSCAEIYACLGVWCVYRFVELEVERAAASVSQLTYVPGSMFRLDSAAVTLILLARRHRAECAFDATARLEKVVALLEERLALDDEEDKRDEDEDGADGDAEAGEENENEELETGTNVEPDAQTRSARGLQGIIFVATRAECRVACEYLNDRLGSRPDRRADKSDSEDEDEDEDKQTELLAETPRFACMLGQAAARDAAAFGLTAMEETLAKFEAGEIACLVSTAVSVEGVDFPQCALLIVASRVETARMLLQLRGRARHEDGVMYYLGEAGDRAHEMHLRAMLREAEAIAALDFRHDKNESAFAQPRSVMLAIEDQDGPSAESRLYVSATGAVLDLDSSVARLNAFCQMLPKVLGVVDLKSLITYEETTAVPVIATMAAPRRPLFRARLQLPTAVAADAPVFKSAPLHSKATAKAAAAFAACKFLHERGLLDDAFHSVYRKRKPEDMSYLLQRLHHE